MVPNGAFDTDLSSWTHTTVQSRGTYAWDNTVFGNSPGSLRYLTEAGRRLTYEAHEITTLSGTIDSTDTVNLSLWWRKTATVANSNVCDIIVSIILPGGGPEVEIWSDLQRPNAGEVLGGTNTGNIDVSSFFTATGTYELKVYGQLRNGNDPVASVQWNVDDIVLDVVPAANNAPAVTAGATQVSPTTVETTNNETTTISTTFTDTDQPGVGAFNVTFRVREPDNATEVTLVNNQPNGGGGLTITDNGGGSYTASYSWDPAPGQTAGAYDLYFDVTDGTDSAVDDYANNLDELTLTTNTAPSVTAGATQVSPATVETTNNETTTISTTFTDTDQPGVGAFNVTFRVREPDNATEVTLVNNQPNGGGGLTITDNGGGSYTASYSWDPAPGQTAGAYDLYFDVTDGTDSAVDDYANNLDELTLTTNTAPSVTAGATQVSPATVETTNNETTTISTTFTDSDQPGVGAFNVTFRVREPDNATEVTLVNNQPNGGGGLTITDNGGGSYTASYTWDPAPGQTAGAYDLYFDVTDGLATATDDYTNNLDELTLTTNTAPSVTAGATQVSPVTIDPVAAEATTISTTFTDSDQPGVGGFTVTFRVREPDNATEVTLVNNQPNGGGGLTITDNGGGSYTASYDWDPGVAQTAGTYDLFFEVSDGLATATDDYTNNLDELTLAPNNPPSVTAGATQVDTSPVNRLGTSTTTISTTFSDSDQPGVGGFTVTFRVREPDNATEVTLVNNQPDGGGGLTITDNGGGSYTASYTWDPGDAQTLGLYDLFFEVSDGKATATDGYANNLDELEVNEIVANNPPVIAAGATVADVSPVNRVGTNSTTISVAFTDADQPGVGAFNVTFKVREPDNATEVILVNNQPDGGGGLTITDNGGGSYTASYTWDPGDTQSLGLYDLYARVSDGSDNATDDYPANPNEIEIIQQNAPTIVLGATQASPGTIETTTSETTAVSAVFTDTDQPGVSGFTVTFKVREPDDATEVILVNNQPNGSGGLMIFDLGGGSYRATYMWDPAPAQAEGLYDLYCEVSDGADAAIDGYTANTNELALTVNEPPVIAAGVTQVSPASIDPTGAASTTISTDFTDADQPGIGGFNVSFRLRMPDNSTDYILVANQPHGSGGLTIVDNGGGSYTASYTWDPPAAQELGTYDLYCRVTDGLVAATDDYADNLDELTLSVPSNPPTLTPGVTQASPATIDAVDNSATTISATFTDSDVPGLGAFIVTLKVRDPDNATEVTLVDHQPHGVGGLTITDNGGGSYTASFAWDPAPAQTTGAYDLYFEVSDGSGTAIDAYADNLDELTLIANNAPVISAGATTTSPVSVDRVGAGTTEFSVTFTDADQPGVGAFIVTFTAREHFTSTVQVVASALQNGVGGLTVSDDGGGTYTARINWDPADNITLGYYDLYAEVSDGTRTTIDAYVNNLSELLITGGGENQPPIVPGDATYATPAALERIGANSTTIAATFTDADQPGIGAFTVTFKLRTPDNVGEIALATNAAHGTSGVTITDVGGGIYTASISWDPPDAQELGFYDLFFSVSDGSASSTDDYANNLDELQLFDAISNNPPTVVAGNTFALPATISRLGSEFTMIQSTFADVDVPGNGAFTITIKVRDTSNVEYTLVNAAVHGEQGLRVRHTGGDSFEASVLWDPGVGQVTGTYDLQFEVTDNNAASATDAFADNLDELTVTATALTGDGYLLRRSHTAADGCGGTASACHNLPDHQTQDCLVCHVPHGSSNIFMVREIIQTPSSGARSVLFKTLGKGDPDNDPDPVVGDPNSGAMADDSDGVHTGVCEVCHTSTNHHQNDGTSPGPGHWNAESCTAACHPHDAAFSPAGGGESEGGVACSCHSSIFTPMNTSTSSYHHQMNGNDPDYSIASRTCLMCHVDHNIFRPDLNTGIGQRAKNLRVDITSGVTQGDAGVLANYDYTSSGTGGICLSCHTSVQTKGYTHPDGSTETKAISKTDFDAATSTHNYSITTTFASDGSSFQATCVKCHNDEMTKNFQNSTVKVSPHDSPYRGLLNSLGMASPSDPLEEKFCFRCHSNTSNPNAGSSQDYYGVKTMSSTALRVEQALSQTYAHPTGTFSGRHTDGETAGDLADGNRHAECGDCHNTHAAVQGTHDGSTNLVSNALKGTWGVEPTSWDSIPATSNANSFVTPSGFTRVDPAQKEYQICLKCHSNYTTLPSGARNLAEEINPTYTSTHGIVQAGTNPFCNSTTMNEPWGTSKIAYCSDCHRSSNAADPEGPHGSNLEHLLVATTVSDDVVGTPLCYVCHKETEYWSGDHVGSRYNKHPSVQGQHKQPEGCFACHMWEFSTDPGVGINSVRDLAQGTIYIHGMNKRFTLNERDGSAGTGELSDSFIDGFLENIDYVNRDCWAGTCKDHSPQSY